MANEETHEAVDGPEAHSGHEEHHEVVQNPDYDGPGNHCLPPPVHDRVSGAVFFTLLMFALAAGAAWLGVHLPI